MLQCVRSVSIMLFAAVSLTLLGLALGRPSTIDVSYKPISDQDREFLKTLPMHRGTYPPGFKEAYLDREGKIVHGSKPSGAYIKVVGSPGASIASVNHVANEIHKMLRYAPYQIFSNLVRNNAGMGVYRRLEKLTIFPEFAALRDTPECRGRCDGSCAITCTSDGRKWDTVAGIGGAISLVEEENVMCYSNDSYRHHDNIAVHEFAHAIDAHGFDRTMRQMHMEAYNYAKAHSLWRPQSYGMYTAAEYFGEATGAFFLVNQQSTPGGMNECYGKWQYCRTEMEARHHIQQQDPKLYQLLVYVYTNNRPQLPSGLAVCP
ncbi:uncharacterized protein LOC143297193 [Babylonia areolata]|uniref:uncharacterized protein LOC143297193 n=1 Tax=Babylonia areolata TaxID=304850 RepID=UPI003FD0412A